VPTGIRNFWLILHGSASRSAKFFALREKFLNGPTGDDDGRGAWPLPLAFHPELVMNVWPGDFNRVSAPSLAARGELQP
jgi:hypothetical protein